MDNFKKITDRKEMEILLQEAVNSKVDVILWQVVNGVRIVMLATLEEFDPDEGIIVFKSIENSKFKFRDEEKINVQSEYRGIIFRAPVVRIDGDETLLSKYPKYIKVVEKRSSHLRQNIEVLHKNIYVELIRPNLKSKFRLLEVSERGASLLIGPKDISPFEEGAEFFITSIGKMNLTRKIQLKVSYVMPYLENQDDYRVGLSFQSKIPHYILNELKNS